MGQHTTCTSLVIHSYSKLLLTGVHTPKIGNKLHFLVAIVIILASAFKGSMGKYFIYMCIYTITINFAAVRLFPSSLICNCAWLHHTDGTEGENTWLKEEFLNEHDASSVIFINSGCIENVKLTFFCSLR